MANKYYFLKGGAEQYLRDLEGLLQRNGHEVMPFAMQDEKNWETEWSKYFVSPVQTEKVSFGWQGLRTAGRALYSCEAKRKFGQFLDEAKPDLVHVHNIYRQISPSILPEAKKRGLPVVLTAHDYALIAPNYSLFHDGEICEITKPDRYFKAVKHRCLKGSKAASFLVALEMWVQHKLKLYQNNVDRFIVPSRFLKAMMVDYGWPEDKIDVLPLFIDSNKFKPSYGGDYALYVGRLSQEKGLSTLVRAAALTKNVPVRIVGRGPEKKALERLAKEIGADNVTFPGFKRGADLQAEYSGARFNVIPSEWYEVFGLIAIEAYAYGKPVIASQIGGLAEVVRDGETGINSSVGSPEKLAEAISELWNSPDAAEEMGRAGRRWVEEEFTPEKHYEGLKEIYKKVGVEL